MHTKSSKIAIILSSLILLSGNAWALTSVVEGIVKDANGGPIKGAEIRIERPGTNATANSVVTDANGHYSCDCLGTGAHRVSVIVNGVTKVSMGDVKANVGGNTKLNFEFKKGVTGRKGHYVLVETTTGSHLGDRWVKVDDEGYADTGGFDHVERKSGALLKRMQDNAGASNGR